ncbi:MAG: hypothetical protein Q4C98_02115 [Capnocytophaga sp.]|nr:hypothetical protein [Capnocytophaga sp.]
MKIIVKGFVTNKKSESYSDCADSYALNTERGRFAISDGVSISFFSAVWSQILVNNFVQGSVWADADFINNCQVQWQQKVDKIVQQPNVKWFVKSKHIKKDFAAATFIGLEIAENQRKWKAQLIGDSFLFFVPKNCTQFKNVLKYPNQENFVFDNYPDYLASLEGNHRGQLYTSPEQELTEGTFFLMTDALSEWFIERLKKDVQNAVESLLKIENQKQFLAKIQRERDENLLKNDDSAILALEVIDDGSDALSYVVAHVTDLYKLVKGNKKEKQKVAKNFVPKTENQSLNISDKF